MTLPVVGARGANVVDLEHRRSKTLRFVVGQREGGNRICIVDDDGLTSFLAGRRLMARSVGRLS